jgi:diacylglycerol kinase (ATP)
MNTAVESFVNIVSPEWQESAGRIKDLAAGAVLCSVIIAVVIGLLIFGNHVFLFLEAK